MGYCWKMLWRGAGWAVVVALLALAAGGCQSELVGGLGGPGAAGDGAVVADGTVATDARTSVGDGAADVGGPAPDGGTVTPPGCTVFPPDNPWNTDISGYAVHPHSDNFVASIGSSSGLHADFGEGTNGIPFVVVPASQPKVPIAFVADPDESDPGPYPIPPDAPIEDGSDRHVIAVDLESCMLYELYDAYPKSNPAVAGWEAAVGAVFNLKSNTLRPVGWTAADAAGLPMYPGLVRYEEVAAGKIAHALRFTVEKTQRAYVLPATHYTVGNTDPELPPMGLRFRLKASVDISSFSKSNQVILTALKKYGMIVADNGGPWFVSGAPNPNWDDDDLHKLQLTIKGSDFEAVDTGPIKTSY